MIKITEKNIIENTKIISDADGVTQLLLPAKGGGIYLPEIISDKSRYLTFFVEAREIHSVAMNLLIFSKKDSTDKPAFNLRFGIMPEVKALICIDLDWLDGHVLFPGHNEGQLKVVCHGRRIERGEISKVMLSNYPCFHDITLDISKVSLTDKFPDEFPLPDKKIIDEMGQYKLKEWPGKIADTDELISKLNERYQSSHEGYPWDDWSEYGGWKVKKLAEGTGYFTKIKKDSKWWLIDPLGYAFLSFGPDCVVARSDCRIDGLEKFMDWLPDKKLPPYDAMYTDSPVKHIGSAHRKPLLFSFEKANLYRAFGDDWYSVWTEYITRQLKEHGMNTLGNWSDNELYGKTKMPYVTTLPFFPTTEKHIFRDFPDVFSPEYRASAKKAAQFLKKYINDSYMIGYYLGNEPAWAFAEGIIIADEVLYDESDSECKKELIRYLKNKYEDIQKLNAAWDETYDSFAELWKSQKNVSQKSDESHDDMVAFSKIMLEQYVAIPSEECADADPNHMNLGIRWAWIPNEIVVTGWQHFDVFSINCYALDPTEDLDKVRNFNVDLPIIIGEFHFGALDAGPTATGLEAVVSQKDRGIAYRHYCEKAAAHPNGVGCHYFQCYDQFALGRFDGENYNIGLFDICSLPYEDMMEHVKEAAANVYEVADGKKKPYDEVPESIPMIAY